MSRVSTEGVRCSGEGETVVLVLKLRSGLKSVVVGGRWRIDIFLEIEWMIYLAEPVPCCSHADLYAGEATHGK